uniref:PAP-associated domain-containing protein n=2 Tax=Echinococcus granulosus TaxID=6210 RepID=A0A7E4SND3_ECHGR
MRELWEVCFLIGVFIFLCFSHNCYRRSRSTSWSSALHPRFSRYASENPTDKEVMKQVRRLAKKTPITFSDNNVDVIYQSNEVVFFLKTLHKSERLNAPMNWCHQNNVPEKSNSSQIIHKVQQCFEAIAISDSARKTIAATLRLIRNAFRNESVPLVMTYGSLLGSLRYHTRMPFDCDYDMAVPFSKWAHIRRIFLRLASEPANQMRMIDFRAVTGCMQIGIACGRNESWRDPTSWSSFNGTITFQDGDSSRGYCHR